MVVCREGHKQRTSCPVTAHGHFPTRKQTELHDQPGSLWAGKLPTAKIWVCVCVLITHPNFQRPGPGQPPPSALEEKVRLLQSTNLTCIILLGFFNGIALQVNPNCGEEVERPNLHDKRRHQNSMYTTALARLNGSCRCSKPQAVASSNQGAEQALENAWLL